MQLIPSTLDIKPHMELLKALPNAIEITTPQASDGTTEIAINVVHVLKPVAIETLIYGFLSIACCLTGRKFLTPVLASEGHTAQSINQSVLIGKLAFTPVVNLICIRAEQEVEVDIGEGKTDIFVVDGMMMTFAARYTTVSLVDNLVDQNPIHVFIQGESTLVLPQ